MTPAVEAVRVPAHLAPPGSPQAKQLCYPHVQLSLGQSCHRQKMSCAYTRRVASIASDSMRPCGLWSCQASLSGRGVLQARILERIGQYWLPYPSRALYFLLPYLPTPLGTWCCQNPCDPSSCTTSTPGPHGANPSPPGQPHGQTPVDDPHAEVEIKPQLKPRGSVTKEKDPKPSHQLFKLKNKSTL